MKTSNTPLQNTTEKLEQRVTSLEQRNAELTAKIAWYEEQFRLSKQRQFGKSSEKTPEDQIELPLFNEAEVCQNDQTEEPTFEEVTYERKKTRRTRADTMKDLPIETIVYNLSPSEQVCSCCSGDLHEMKTEVRRELKVIPAEVKVVEHHRAVYACRFCERHGTETQVKYAAVPAPVFPKSMASPSALAHIITQKFIQGLPLYRQEAEWKRFGVTLSRQTMSNWLMYASKTYVEPLYQRMHHHLLKEKVLHADESVLQVIQEEGRSASTSSYMWLYRTTGQSGPPIVLFDYQTTRASKHPVKFLQTFDGYLHVDGYAGYNNLGATLVGCWAHARRKFHEAKKSAPENPNGTPSLAEEGLQYCNQLYTIERNIRHMVPEDRQVARQERSRPIVDAFYAWAQINKPKVTPKSLLGQALTYALNQKSKLLIFLEDGQLEIDNNRSERSIKPFVIGRKNWLFSATSKGAQSSALIYSLVETAKENQLHPFRYITFLFETLPNLNLEDADALDRCLPWSKDLPLECYLTSKTT